FHIDDILRGLQQHLAGERLAYELVTNRHVGNEKSLAVALLARANRQSLTHRQKFRVFLNIRDKAKHLLCPVMHPPDGGKLRHVRSQAFAAICASRAALSLAKSSPA